MSVSDPPESKGRGRPSEYSQAVADFICEEIATGKSLRAVCASADVPASSTVFHWLAKYPEFRAQYATAKELAADAIAEEIFDIADDGRNDWMEKLNFNGGVKGWEVNGEALNRSRLRVDSRKWYLSKIMPKKYGDKITQEIDAKVVTESREAAQLAEVMTPEELATIHARLAGKTTARKDSEAK